MYTHKNLKCGFVILCPEHKVGLLKSTVKSIQCRYLDCPIVCVTDDSATALDMKEMKDICVTFKAKSTFTSLINKGMKHTKGEWNFIVLAGSTVSWDMNGQYSYFIDNEKDILFPIVNRKTNFVDATFNGLFINKKTWKEVGEMENEGTIEEIKILWATKAIEKGVRFKAIAGSKIC